MPGKRKFVSATAGHSVGRKKQKIESVTEEGREPLFWTAKEEKKKLISSEWPTVDHYCQLAARFGDILGQFKDPQSEISTRTEHDIEKVKASDLPKDVKLKKVRGIRARVSKWPKESLPTFQECIDELEELDVNYATEVVDGVIASFSALITRVFKDKNIGLESALISLGSALENTKPRKGEQEGGTMSRLSKARHKYMSRFKGYKGIFDQAEDDPRTTKEERAKITIYSTYHSQMLLQKSQRQREARGKQAETMHLRGLLVMESDSDEGKVNQEGRDDE